MCWRFLCASCRSCAYSKCGYVGFFFCLFRGTADSLFEEKASAIFPPLHRAGRMRLASTTRMGIPRLLLRPTSRVLALQAAAAACTSAVLGQEANLRYSMLGEGNVSALDVLRVCMCAFVVRSICLFCLFCLISPLSSPKVSQAPPGKA